MANPARAYLTTQVETTTQGELLIMLYEAAIKFLKRSKVEIDNKDFAKKGIYISKAMAIIHELAECLNKERGGDITPKLGALYQFCTSHLIKANIRLDKKMIDEVIKILEGLHSAYAQIVPIHEGKVAPPAQDNAQISTNQPAPIRPQTPQAPPILPTAPPVAPQPAAAQAASQPAPSAPAPQAAQPPVVPAEEKAAAPKKEAAPVPPKPMAPPKLRSAFNAAKFRAANAYTNNR
ncbi:MAG: flagellar export chaperone FliS [Pseudodesulfovibrio sp.]